MKILTIDIETSPHLSWHWRRWQENIPPEFTVEESRVISWAAKWAGEREVMFASEWEEGPDMMIELAYDLMDEADVIVGFNSNRFDIKRLNTEFIDRGWTPPSPFHKVDLMQQAKKNFAFSSNKLKSILARLELTPKIDENVNMKLWIDVMNGKRSAQKTMKAYNKQDVRSTEELYDYMLGWIQPHPNWGLHVDDNNDAERPVCPNCGGQTMHRHKVRTTRVRRYQQWHCQDCGKYSRGRKHMGAKGEEQGVIL